MSIIKNYQFTISKQQRIQIRCESNFSLDVLHELIALRPIEVSAKMSDDSCRLNISLPQGLVAVVLSEVSDSPMPYFADIENQIYGRLNLPISVDEQSWYLSFNRGFGFNMGDLAKAPIVIKFYGHAKGESIVFAATESFRITNTKDARFKHIVSDPSRIPDALLRLVEIIDEPLPENRVALEILEERVKTTKKLLEMYTNKQFSIDVKEEIKLSIAELVDFEMKVNAKIEGIKFGAFGFEAAIFGRVNAKLKQVVGTKKYENILASIYKDVMAEFRSKQESTSFVSEGNVFEKILERIEDYGVKPEVLRHLNAQTHRAFFPYACSKCNGEPLIERGTDNKYRVSCKACGNTTKIDFHSKSRSTSIGGWNKENFTGELDCWLILLGLEVSDKREFQSKIKNMNRCLSDMMLFWKENIERDISNSAGYSAINELLEMVKFINMVFKEANKPAGSNKEVD